jgi:hypothetical protein
MKSVTVFTTNFVPVTQSEFLLHPPHRNALPRCVACKSDMASLQTARKCPDLDQESFWREATGPAGAPQVSVAPPHPSPFARRVAVCVTQHHRAPVQRVVHIKYEGLKLQLSSSLKDGKSLLTMCHYNWQRNAVDGKHSHDTSINKTQ